MKTFTIKADDSFKFTSKLAFDTSEVFTAFVDRYKTGYICIDSKGNSFILEIEDVRAYLLQGIYKIVDEDTDGNINRG